jgi:hypothetical protein
MERTPIETLDMCCGSRRCPVVTLYSDGSLVMTDGDQRIEFTPEQVADLRHLISSLPSGRLAVAK